MSARPTVAPSSTPVVERAARACRPAAPRPRRRPPARAAAITPIAIVDRGPGVEDRRARLAAVAAGVAHADRRPGEFLRRERAVARCLGEPPDLVARSRRCPDRWRVAKDRDHEPSIGVDGDAHVDAPTAVAIPSGCPRRVQQPGGDRHVADQGRDHEHRQRREPPARSRTRRAPCSRPSGTSSPAGSPPDRGRGRRAIARRVGESGVTAGPATVRRRSGPAPPRHATSSAVTRPPGPVPAIVAEVDPRAPWRACEPRGRGDLPRRTRRVAGVGRPRRVDRRTSRAARRRGSASPTSPWRRRRPRPANGDGISTVAFAVSTSTSGWFSVDVVAGRDQPRRRSRPPPDPRPGPASRTRARAISTPPSRAPRRRSARRWAGSAPPATRAGTARPSR